MTRNCTILLNIRMNQSTFALSVDSIVVAAKNQISSDLQGREVILNIKSGVYYGLDGVGTRIWNLLQQPRTVKEIRDMLLDHYDVNTQRAEVDLMALLQKLSDAGLIEVQHGPTA